MKVVKAVLLFIALAGPAKAHDSWLEPRSFRPAAGAAVPMTFYVGHSGDQRSVRLTTRPPWLVSLQAHGPRGATNLLKVAGFQSSSSVKLPAAGSYTLALDTSDFRHEMSPAEFGTYLEEEGLAGAQAAWARSPIKGRKVREAFRRHAKALVQVGSTAASSSQATHRLGQRLEIVPAASPYTLKAGQALPTFIWYRGRPLVGALVTLGSLDRPKEPLLTERSDSQGRVSFRMPESGRWMMNVVWSVPSKAKGTDFETSFSSLTFAAAARD